MEDTELSLTLDEMGLYQYIPSIKRVKGYVERLRACHTLRQVIDSVILYMLVNEQLVTFENALRKEFYTKIQPFIRHICAPIPVTTWRDGILRLKQLTSNSAELKEQMAAKWRVNHARTTSGIVHAGANNIKVSVTTGHAAVVDLLRVGAHIEGVKYHLSMPTTLAQKKSGGIMVKTIELIGRHEAVKGIVVPAAQLATALSQPPRKRRVKLWNPIAYGRVVKPSPNIVKARKGRRLSDWQINL